ncbi:MAG: hypothetical protein COT43_08800 [Candidatus Marinimicrobia bacterium CG08_land_8_20_14_0_20_45_22]|nr:MAG: hypothetical protein COT43_08800 [Candidatus Marinimicrobia bacterium CG08_land_8_20_14_0_20_45_22]
MILQKLKFHHLQPKTLISIFLILVLLLSLSAYSEYISRRRSVTQMMSVLSQGLSEIIRKAAVNAILSYDAVETEFASRQIEALHFLDPTDFSTKALRRFANRYGFDRVQIIESNGGSISSNQSSALSFPPPIALKLLGSNLSEIILGWQFDSTLTTNLFGVAVNSGNGFVAVGYSRARHLLDLRKETGLGSLINSITQDSGVIYIAIQDSLGILAATEAVDSLSSFPADPFMQTVIQEKSFRWRIDNFHDEKIFEGVLPFNVQEFSYGAIRIGLNYRPIQNIETAAFRQVFIRIGILFIIGFILAVYSISLQNIYLLESEKKQITDEVYRLQADLRQREKLSAMGELAAGVAHEIRNPLNAISMTIQRLAKEFPPTNGDMEQVQLIQSVRKEIARIGEIINQFLAFARPAPLQKSRQNATELITKVVNIYQATCDSRRIRLIWQQVSPIKSFLDSDKITQCLINLLENAISATPDGGRIEIILKKSQGKIIISIRDTGSGISPENISKIFNLYFTTKPNGTGFGLAQAYQIISEHGGSIGVKSKENLGSQFTITIPNQ